MTTLRKLYRRDVPLEAQRQLEALCPRSEHTSWLYLIHEEGYPWEGPVDRFIVYQMTPDVQILDSHGRRANAIPDFVLEQLQHPKPPSQMGNYYDHVLQEFVRNPDCVITERAWRLYREFKAWGKPFWVVQGADGGHKRWFSETEKKFLRMAGLPSDPPAPGDLPYAPFDERVMAKLREWDLLHRADGSLARAKKILAGAHSAKLDADERVFRERLVKWLAEQMTEAADSGGVVRSLQQLDAPRSKRNPRDYEKMAEQADQNFIETGRTHGGADLSGLTH